MYKRLSAILFPIVTVMLIGAAYWGYQENQEKNSILIKAENTYQRSFHDLSYRVDRLHNELGQALAVNSASNDFERKSLINVWRLTSEAQSDISQLPLSLLPFNKTGQFLGNVAKFSYATAVRDLTKKPLSPTETKTLKSLYERAKEISGELRGVQKTVIAHNLRWMDVETALATENTKLDNAIIDGFKTVDKKVNAYTELDWGPAVVGLNQKKNFQMLSGPGVTVDQIKRKAAAFLGMKDGSSLKVVENGKGTDYHTYSVTGQRTDHSNVFLDYAYKNGELVWYMHDRTSTAKKLTLAHADQAARKFLTAHGYPKMESVNYEVYDHAVNITYANVKDNVIIYPEKLTAKVALDNGEMIGLQSGDYLYIKKDRKIPKASMSVDAAKKKLNSDFQVFDHSMAIINNEMQDEVLCHQFTGHINNTNYRIFLNADTGLEEKIENVKQSDIQ